jgi:hypothetical protein
VPLRKGSGLRTYLQSGVRVFAAALLINLAAAQDPSQSGPPMSGMNMVEMNPASMYLMNLSSGTSQNPESWPMPMLLKPIGTWNTAFMGVGFLSDIQQSGPRGADKL